MPLKLRDPTPGKTPNYHIRGTHRGIYVERTAGTSSKAEATRIMREIRDAIERGDYSPAAETTPSTPSIKPLGEATFAEAALAYLKAGGDGAHLSKIIEQTGRFALRDLKISSIDQITIDNAASALYPDATAQTRNRQFYTPVSAVLKRAGVERAIKRPTGWRGNKATEWLEPDQAFAAIEEAYKLDPEFGLLCLSYLYTGRRMSDFLNAKLRHLKLEQSLIYLPESKNGDPVPVHLPPVLVQAFHTQPARKGRPRREGATALANGLAGQSRADAGVPFLKRHPDAKLFRYHAGGRLRDLLKETFRRAGIVLPRRQAGFHIFCHTYGTWMTRYGGLDTFGLVRTKRWKDPDSADRYSHTIASAEARRADMLPTPPSKIRGISGEKPRPRKKA